MNLVKRNILDKIYFWLESPHILVIHGARRTGKTTLLHILKSDLEAKGKKVVYLPMDQMLFEPCLKDPISLENWLKQEGLLSQRRLYLLLDEAQYLPDAGIFLKVLHDRLSPKVKLIVSGSSSLELAKTREFLTGRKIELHLERFSFLEFLSLRFPKPFVKQAPFSDLSEIKEIYELYGQRLKELFVEYISWGGYPEVVLEEIPDKKQRILREILSVYLEKDVSAFLKIRQVSAFNNLIRILASQIGSLVNKTELSNTLGIRFETINSYLDILKHTFIFSFLSPFFRNVRKEISKSPKIYARDMGIMRYVLKKGYDDYRIIPGEVVENFVYRELIERFPISDIYFYRTLAGGEIDFVVSEEKFYLIESKFCNQKRFPKAIKNFIERYSEKESLVIVITKDILEFHSEIIYLPALCLPFWKF